MQPIVSKGAQWSQIEAANGPSQCHRQVTQHKAEDLYPLQAAVAIFGFLQQHGQERLNLKDLCTLLHHKRVIAEP
jgi:selenophosphate synthase